MSIHLDTVKTPGVATSGGFLLAERGGQFAQAGYQTERLGETV